MLLFPAGDRPGCRCAVQELERRGVALCRHVSPEVTHLLLDIPSQKDIRELLSMLPENITVIGGNLDHLTGYRRIDLLKDETYLAKNAAITADCAIKVARENMAATWAGSKVLILGWGRIGKCLARDLRALGAQVSVFARKERDRAMIAALGYEIARIPDSADVVFNTVPQMIWQDCPISIKIDLASSPGLGGENVIWARGLPGLHAPQTTGKLIAQRILEVERR